jgi:hypothetical protein
MLQSQSRFFLMDGAGAASNWIKHEFLHFVSQRIGVEAGAAST